MLLKYSIHSSASRRQRDISVWPQEGHFNNGAWEEARKHQDAGWNRLIAQERYFISLSEASAPRMASDGLHSNSASSCEATRLVLRLKEGSGLAVVESVISVVCLIIVPWTESSLVGPFRVTLHSTNPRTASPPSAAPAPSCLPLSRSPSCRMGPVAQCVPTPLVYFLDRIMGHFQHHFSSLCASPFVTLTPRITTS